MDEAALVAACSRIKDANCEKLTAVQVHAALSSEGIVAELGQVKKACSKAEKERAKAPAPEAAVARPECPAEGGKAAAKAKKVAAESLLAAEQVIVESQKALRDQWLSDGVGTPPPPDGKALIDYATSRALSGQLAADEVVTKQRVQADYDTLHWLLSPGCPVELPEDTLSTARRRLETLKTLRSNRFIAEAYKECYVAHVEVSTSVPEPVIGKSVELSDTGSLDRAMARAGLLDATTVRGVGEMDEMD